MKRHGFTLWQALALIALVVIAALVLIPIFERAHESSFHSSCQSNLKQIDLAIQQYTQDYDDKYPLVSVKDAAIDGKNPLGWADAMSPYIKSQAIFWCPTCITTGARDKRERKPHELGYTDYWYNSRFVPADYSKLSKSVSTILLGDGNDGTDATNARYSLSTLPAAWRADKNSPAYRHLDGANYAFADGHVKWLKPEKIADTKPNGKNYTFAIR